MTPDDLRSRIRDVPDFPKPGIMFKDLTPLMADGKAFRATQELLAERVATYRPDVIVGMAFLPSS